MLFVHLMVSVVTLCVVFLTDLRIMTGRFTKEGIQKAAHNTALLLAVTGSISASPKDEASTLAGMLNVGPVISRSVQE